MIKNFNYDIKIKYQTDETTEVLLNTHYLENSATRLTCQYVHLPVKGGRMEKQNDEYVYINEIYKYSIIFDDHECITLVYTLNDRYNNSIRTVFERNIDELDIHILKTVCEDDGSYYY